MLTFRGRFESLIARPPTPPKETNEDITDALDFLDGDHTTPKDLYGRLGCNTPPTSSPSSSADLMNRTCRASSKRVEFSPWTNYHKAPTFDRSQLSPVTPLRTLQPSKQLKSSKSILKPFDRTIPPIYDAFDTNGRAASPYRFATFAEMLESIVQQLAGDVRSGRMDAYITLLGTLSACDGTPDSDAMQNKMGLITQFIRRDATATLPSLGTLDTPLATQALKLVCALTANPVYSEKFDDEFRAFLLDRSIAVLEDPHIPKAIGRHHMYVLAQQKFGANVVTPERADRIVTHLVDIDQRVSGNGVIGLRLAVYSKLLSQAQSTMVARSTDWLHHVFDGMLSSIREIRERAIELGMQAGRSLGHFDQVCKTVTDLLDNDSHSQGKYVDFLETRLKASLESNDRERKMNVPHVWSVVILFFQSKRHRLEKWSHFKKWLSVIQRCFNFSDLSVKHQANVAWNRLVCAFHLDSTTPRPIIKMLRQPLITQLERKGTDGYAMKARQSALSSYNFLLYYAFQPSASAEQIDLYWDEYVAPVLSNALLSTHKHTQSACEILASLFGNVSATNWKEDRAHTVPSEMKFAELPRLDPKWTRRRIVKVLELVSGCMDAANTPDSDAEPSLRRMWTCLVGALANASSSEIRASMELKSAIAHIMNLLHRTWVRTVFTSTSSTINPSFAARFEFLTLTAIQGIGPIYFADKILIRNDHSQFEAAVTPSHRSFTSQGSLQSPLLHLLELLARVSPEDDTGIAFAADAARKMLHFCSSVRSSRQPKLDLLYECVSCLSQERGGPASCYQVWRAIVQCTKSMLSDDRNTTSDHVLLNAGQENKRSVLTTSDLSPSNPVLKRPNLPILTPERRIRSSPKRQTPKARLRHDDSQVVFAAIDSSPLNPAAIDSQMLTDRQKEVRVRQRTETDAMFPNILSSPLQHKAQDDEDLPKRGSAIRKKANGVAQSLTPPETTGMPEIAHLVTHPSLPPGSAHKVSLAENANQQAERAIEQDVSIRDNIPSLPPAMLKAEINTFRGPPVQDGASTGMGVRDQVGKEQAANVNTVKENDMRVDNASTMVVALQNKYLSSKSSRPIAQVDGTDEADMEQLQDHSDKLEDPVMNAARPDRLDQDELIDNRPAGGIQQDVIVGADQPGAEQRIWPGNQRNFNPGVPLLPAALDSEAAPSSPLTSRTEVFVDAPSSPNEPQVFVDASQTLMPAGSDMPDDMNLTPSKTGGALLVPRTNTQHKSPPSEGIVSRVQDSFRVEKGHLSPETEENTFVAQSIDSTQLSSQMSVPESQATPSKKTRKRKRHSWTSQKSAKKVKREVSSPFPSFFGSKASFGGNDDEIGDCIVVASQPSQSSQGIRRSLESVQTPGPQQPPKRPSDHPTKRNSQHAKVTASEIQNPRKRRLGLSGHEAHDGVDEAVPASFTNETSGRKRRRTLQYSPEADAAPSVMEQTTTPASPPARTFSHVAIPISSTPPTTESTTRRQPPKTGVAGTSRKPQLHEPEDDSSSDELGIVAPVRAKAAQVIKPELVNEDGDGSQVSQQVYAELEAAASTPLRSQGSRQDERQSRSSGGIL